MSSANHNEIPGKPTHSRLRSIMVFYLALLVWYPCGLVSNFVVLPELNQLDLFDQEDGEPAVPSTSELVENLFGSKAAIYAETTEQKWKWFWGLTAICAFAFVAVAGQGFSRTKDVLMGATMPALFLCPPLLFATIFATPLRLSKRLWLPTSIFYLGLGMALTHQSLANIQRNDRAALISNICLHVGLACILGSIIKIVMGIRSMLDGMFREEPIVAARATLFEPNDF